MTLALRYGARSDVGLLRDGNEDAMYAGPRLLAVADGMGGHAAGEVASRIAIETVAGLDLDEPGSDLITAMRDAVESANGYLRDMVTTDTALEGMGTTLTALLWAGQRLGLVHVGDSRAYLFRDGILQQITHDHTLVQSLVDEGRITPEEATTHPQRSWITRALDGRGEVDMDLSVRETRPGDRYLLCTDGLSGVVSEDTICAALALPSPQESCDRLVELALRAGGPDNVTCIVADIVDEAAVDDEGPIVGGAAADHRPPNRIDDTPAARAAVIHHKGRHKGRSDGHVRDEGRGADTDGSSRRVAYLLAGVAVIVVAGVAASWLYVRTQYYVGVADGHASTVAVYRGVTGDVVGLGLSRVDEHTDIPVSALPEFERTRVQSGIDAKNVTDARRIVAQLREEACTKALPTPSPLPTAKKRPTPLLTPAYCKATP